MSSIFKYLPHIIIILLLGLFVFGILKGCQSIKSNTDKLSDAGEKIGMNDDKNSAENDDTSIDDLFDETDDSTAITDGETAGGEIENDDSETPDENVKNSSNGNAVSDSSTSEDTPSSSSSIDGKYLVIIGSFSHEANAKREAKRLQGKGYESAEVVEFDQSQYFSVSAGRYNSLSSARSMKNKLSAANIEAYVHKMRGKKVGS